MTILLAAIVLFSLFTVYLNNGIVEITTGEQDHKKRMGVCLFGTIMWIVLSGFRHLKVGADTLAYEFNFYRAADYSWHEIFSNIWGTYRGEIFVKDPGYDLLEKAFISLGGNYRLFLILIAIVFFSGLGVWIYDNSKVPYVSFLLFSTLFYSFYAFTGNRQTIATAIIVFLGDKLIRKRKLIPFLLIALIASTIHKSCICFIPIYFMYPFRNYSRRTYVVSLLLGFVILSFSAPFWNFIGEFLHYEDFLTNDIGGTGTFVFLFFLVLLIAIVQFPSIVEKDKDVYGTFNVLWLGSMMVAMSYINQSFMRVQQYFTLYLMLLLPDIIISFSEKDQLFVACIGCGMLLFFFIMNHPHYMFFWQ